MESLQSVAAAFFALAVFHTFCVKGFLSFATRFPPHSFARHFFHALGEVELVFAIWAALLMVVGCFCVGWGPTSAYLTSLDFTEPCFIFVILTIASTRPILWIAAVLIEAIARLLPLRQDLSFFLTALIVGPVLGSFITEPAAMTVTALLLKKRYFDGKMPTSLKYLTLAVLFVNVSIGGVLTSFAAPPVLMVASKWGWDSLYMVEHFGWKAMIAVVLNSAGACWLLSRSQLSFPAPSQENKSKAWLALIHFIFLGAVVIEGHHPSIFALIFVAFLGFIHLTPEYQSKLKTKEALLVGIFLGGLMVLGSFQAFWVAPLVQSLPEHALFWGATALTAVLDNAALTYLGAQVPDLADTLKYFLVAGAVAGGGLTIIANAPNPAGYGILNNSFGAKGISPFLLLKFALVPTLIACVCFLAL